MPRRQTRTILLSQELDRVVADQVASGHYSSASEVVRARLRTLIEGQSSPDATPVGDSVG
ncbi:type II toxin-antitoxin system ParD family antitoxin [Sphingomonas floccifaciens]|uniref:Type II toxin-antitoxin system ParD family antitoxin n=1 Tax=Sphingomonas floccifaciens TaxID=1844115 RepID=A0ABW4NDF2_9SPHN